MNRSKYRKVLITAGCMSLLLSGCFNNRVEKEIAAVKKENEEMRAESSEILVEDFDEGIESGEISIQDIELHEEQTEILKNAHQTSSSEAIEHLNDHTEHQEAKVLKVETPEFFDNPEDLSQYVAEYFFHLHSGQINGEEFSSAIVPFAHSTFLSMIPEDEHEQEELFGTISKLFMEQLTSPLESYQLSEPEFIRGEAIVYRKYIQKDLRTIDYMTVMVEEDGAWTLLDDRPAESVIIKANEE